MRAFPVGPKSDLRNEDPGLAETRELRTPAFRRSRPTQVAKVVRAWRPHRRFWLPASVFEQRRQFGQATPILRVLLRVYPVETDPERALPFLLFVVSPLS